MSIDELIKILKVHGCNKMEHSRKKNQWHSKHVISSTQPPKLRWRNLKNDL